MRSTHSFMILQTSILFVSLGTALPGTYTYYTDNIENIYLLYIIFSMYVYTYTTTHTHTHTYIYIYIYIHTT